MATPTMQKVAKDARTYSGTIAPGWLVLSQTANPDGIKEVTVNGSKLVSSIELSTGELVPRAESPHLTAYLLLLLYPVIGFLLPWGCIRILTWVGTGFVAPRGYTLITSAVGRCYHPWHQLG